MDSSGKLREIYAIVASSGLQNTSAVFEEVAPFTGL